MWFEIHDATGALLQKGRSGALFKIIFYHKATNVIHIETIKSRSGLELLGALQRAVKIFTDRGATSLLVRMDNECADLTKT